MTTRHISVILPHRARLQHTSMQRVQTATSGLGELFEITRGSADVSGWLLSLSCSVYQAIIMSDQPFYGTHPSPHTHITHTESPGVCSEVHTPECPKGSK